MKKYFFLLLLFTILIKTNDDIDLYTKQLEYCDKLSDPESVKACKNNVLLIATSNKRKKQKRQQLKKDNAEKKENDKTEVINNVANIANDFVKLTTDTKNPLTVSQAVCSVIMNIINIAIAMKK